MDRNGATGAGAAGPTAVVTVVVALVVAAGLTMAVGPVGSVGAQPDTGAEHQSGTATQGTGEVIDCSFPVTATDATGTEVTVQTQPERVVALAPSAAQQLWAIGAADRVVGMPVNEYTDYLGDRENVTNVVGEDGEPVQEQVVGLEPDLVLAPNVIRNETVESLRRGNLTVYRYDDARSLADVAEELERTGLLVRRFPAAANESARMRGTVDAVRDAVNGTEPPRVYYDLGGGWTAGANTFVHDLIETAGGENVADAAGIGGYAEISQEVVADADPEVLVVHEGAEIPDSPAIQNSTAVREDTVVRVDADYINQPGPRNLVVLRTLAEAFHPEAVDDADLGNITGPAPARCASAGNATETGTASPTDASTEQDDETTVGSDGPGFGVIAALLAAVGTALLAVRRR